MSPQGYGSPPLPVVQLGPPPPFPEDARFVVSFDPHSPEGERGETQFFKVRETRSKPGVLRSPSGVYSGQRFVSTLFFTRFRGAGDRRCFL